jgi:hypothetical protein
MTLVLACIVWSGIGFNPLLSPARLIGFNILLIASAALEKQPQRCTHRLAEKNFHFRKSI